MGNRVSYCEEAASESNEEVAERVEDAPAEEEAPEEEEKADIKLRTAPIDFRFPSTNQARTCYTHYNEYYKCVAEKGEDSSDCAYHKRFYRSICPDEWLEKWEELRSEDNWFGKY